MDINKEKDFSMRNFNVLLEVPKEEYILSDPITSETSLSSRFHSSMELKPEPENLDFDPLGDDKRNLKKSVIHMKNEKPEIYFEEEFLTIKEESEWEDIGIEEELIQFTNQEENCNNEEILTANLNIANNQKRDELHQGITSLLLQSSRPANAKQTCPIPLRDYKQIVTETSTKSANSWNTENCKTREIKNDHIYVNHSQNIKNQSTRSFSRDPQQMCYQNTDLVPKRNMVNTHTNNLKTSAVVSSNIDALRNLLQSTPSPSQYERNKARGKHLPEKIQIRDDPDDARYENNCDNAINSHSSTFYTKNLKRLCHTNEISREKNETELEVIVINESSEDNESNKNYRNRVSCNNILKRTKIDGSDNSDLNSNTIFDSIKTVTHDHAVFKARKMKITTVSVSHQNLPEEDYCRKLQPLPKKVLKTQQPQKKYILKSHFTHQKSKIEGRKFPIIPRKLVKLTSQESTSKQLVVQSNNDRYFRNYLLSGNVKYSKVKQIFQNEKNEVSASDKRGRDSLVDQPRWKCKHSNSAVDSFTKKDNLVLLPINIFHKTAVTSTQSLEVQDSVVYSSTNSEELRETNMIRSENINILSSFSASSDTASENIHNSSCECLNCKIKGASSGSKRNIVCQKCGKIFKSEVNLNRHMSQVHSEEKRFVCLNCCKAYNSKHALEYHILSYHSLSALKSKCKMCHKYFANKDNLSLHIQQAHSKTKINVPETCDICQKVFKSRPNMLTHKLRKHNTSNKKFICNDCSAVFSDKNPLINHIKVNHMPPEIKCSLCSEYFPTKVKLLAHLRQEHGKDSRKSYICETCGKTTKTRLALENHQTTHTDNKAYICEDCGKSFRTITNLHQHSRIHSDIRPFSCNLCDQSFRIRHHLRQHMAVHGMDSISNYSKRARRNITANDSEDEEENS